jgi:hypothetical protein
MKSQRTPASQRPRKLSLSRESLRRIDDTRLAQVAGGGATQLCLNTQRASCGPECTMLCGTLQTLC